MVAAKRVLWYLKGTPDLCVRYSKDFTLYGYFDASHSDDPNNSRSVSGYLYMFAGGPVTWSSKNNRWLRSRHAKIGVYRTSIRQPISRISVWFVAQIKRFPSFLPCRCTRTTRELFSYQVLQHSRQGPNTFVRDTIFCASWLNRTRSSYLISRQQISWRTFSPKSWLYQHISLTT